MRSYRHSVHYGETVVVNAYEKYVIDYQENMI